MSVKQIQDSLVSRSIKNKHPSGYCFFIVRMGLRTRTKQSFVAKFERERAEAEVAETLSFRHVMPFIASEQDSLVSRSIKNKHSLGCCFFMEERQRG